MTVPLKQRSQSFPLLTLFASIIIVVAVARSTRIASLTCHHASSLSCHASLRSSFNITIISTHDGQCCDNNNDGLVPTGHIGLLFHVASLRSLHFVTTTTWPITSSPILTSQIWNITASSMIAPEVHVGRRKKNTDVLDESKWFNDDDGWWMMDDGWLRHHHNRHHHSSWHEVRQLLLLLRY